MLGRILSSEFIQLPRRLDFMAGMATKVSVCSQCQLHVYTIFLVSLVVNSPPANASVREAGSIPGSGRSPGGGHDNPLQYPCLENPVDRGVWWATFHSVTKSQTQLEYLSMHAPYFYFSDILERTEQKEMDFVRSSLDIWDNICFSQLGLCSLLFVSHTLTQIILLAGRTSPDFKSHLPVGQNPIQVFVCESNYSGILSDLSFSYSIKSSNTRSNQELERCCVYIEKCDTTHTYQGASSLVKEFRCINSLL